MHNQTFATRMEHLSLTILRQSELYRYANNQPNLSKNISRMRIGRMCEDRPYNDRLNENTMHIILQDRSPAKHIEIDNPFLDQEEFPVFKVSTFWRDFIVSLEVR